MSLLGQALILANQSLSGLNMLTLCVKGLYLNALNPPLNPLLDPPLDPLLLLSHHHLDNHLSLKVLWLYFSCVFPTHQNYYTIRNLEDMVKIMADKNYSDTLSFHLENKI